MLALDKESDLVVICQQAGFVCVVVPAVGLGWIEMAQLLKLEVSVPEPNRGLVELGLESETIEELKPQAFCGFLESVGPLLCGVDLSHNSLMEEFDILGGLTTHCPHLKHLVLGDYDMSPGEWTRLFNALRGDFGRRLVSLSFNDTSLLDAGQLAILSDILASDDNFPALEELGLDVDAMDDTTRVRLSEALQGNMTLAFLELPEPEEGYQDRSISRSDFEVAHGWSVMTGRPLLLMKKLAFLSAVTAGGGAGRRALDSNMLAQVFTFAQNRGRRRILWQRPRSNHWSRFFN